MQKFFVDKSNISESKVIISGDDIKHVIRVLRKNVGDVLTVSDGLGMEYEVKISQIDKERLWTDIIQQRQVQMPILQVVLYQALPKLDKMDAIIQKCTELGVSKIVPFISEYTVVAVNDNKSERKIERWKKIALEACKQCGRSVIPEIGQIHTFERLLDEIREYDLTILAYEKENSSIKKLLCEKSDSKQIAVIIGPEGGFSEDEVQKMANHSAEAVGLGPRILRTETAGMAVLSIIMYELGDMGNEHC